MMAKMTPIEWLVNEANLLENNGWILPLIEKAKQLEKLKNHSEYMSGWYNGFNSQEIETKGLEKTAVEWLYNKMYEYKGNITISEYEQAKEMEKQQRQKDFKAGNDSACMDHENIEDYFNEYIKSK